MSDGGVVRPFRWDIRRRSQLGSLPDVDLPETYDWFEEELFRCTARVLAFAGDSDLRLRRSVPGADLPCPERAPAGDELGRPPAPTERLAAVGAADG
jgi:hypothetical protein